LPCKSCTVHLHSTIYRLIRDSPIHDHAVINRYRIPLHECVPVDRRFQPTDNRNLIGIEIEDSIRVPDKFSQIFFAEVWFGEHYEFHSISSAQKIGQVLPSSLPDFLYYWKTVTISGQGIKGNAQYADIIDSQEDFVPGENMGVGSIRGRFQNSLTIVDDDERSNAESS
jgi:hypothetical protein